MYVTQNIFVFYFYITTSISIHLYTTKTDKMENIVQCLVHSGYNNQLCGL